MTLTTTPTTSITATPRFGLLCDRRWREWRGPLAVWLQSQPSHPSHPTMTVLQAHHREWLLHLLSLGITMRQVRRLGMDDPRVERLYLSAKVDLYLAGRRRRNGTVE